MRTEVRFSGTGGQGLILAAIVLAEAEGVELGKYVVQTQSYGPEARGGASKADVIIGDEQILSTGVSDPDYFICLSQQAYERYAGSVHKGILIYDPMFVTPAPREDVRQIALEATQIAQDAGSRRSANIVSLGGLCAAMVNDYDAMLRAVKRRVPAKSIEANSTAFEQGYAKVKEVL